jgi:pyruvate/2-oxoglutarate dehydrogenase complex dihydrolipoamide dehydrogenase (E3) component
MPTRYDVIVVGAGHGGGRCQTNVAAGHTRW